MSAPATGSTTESSMVDGQARKALKDDLARFDCRIHQPDDPPLFTREPRSEMQTVHWRWKDLEPLLELQPLALRPVPPPLPLYGEIDVPFNRKRVKSAPHHMVKLSDEGTLPTVFSLASKSPPAPDHICQPLVLAMSGPVQPRPLSPEPFCSQIIVPSVASWKCETIPPFSLDCSSAIHTSSPGLSGSRSDM